MSHRLPVTSPGSRPFRMNLEDEEWWRHGESPTPAWRQMARASPLRFSAANRFDDAGNRHLTGAEVEIVKGKMTAEVYKPQAQSCNPCGKIKKDGSEENNHTCSICLEDFAAKQQLYRLPCMHRFHSNCVKPWILSNGQCPVCRFDLTGRPSTTNEGNVPPPHLPVADMALNSADELALFIRAIEESLAWR